MLEASFFSRFIVLGCPLILKSWGLTLGMGVGSSWTGRVFSGRPAGLSQNPLSVSLGLSS